MNERKPAKNINGKRDAVASNPPPKDIRLGDGVLDAGKAKINQESQEIITTIIDMISNWLKQKIKDAPDIIKQLQDNQEIRDEIAVLWSQQLYERGIISSGYNGLPDECLIHNFHQDAYLDGMYLGYLISVTTLAENGVSKDVLIAAHKDIISKFLGKDYESRKSLRGDLEGEIHKWNEGPNTISSDQ